MAVLWSQGRFNVGLFRGMLGRQSANIELYKDIVQS